MSWLSDLINAYAEGRGVQEWGPGWREKVAQLKATTKNLGLQGEQTVAETERTQALTRGEGIKQTADLEELERIRTKYRELAKKGYMSPEAAEFEAQQKIKELTAKTAQHGLDIAPTPGEATAQRAAELGQTKAQTAASYAAAHRARTEPGTYAWMIDPNSGQPVLYNPKSHQIATLPGGASPGQAPTADMRNRAVAKQLVQSSVNAVRELSEGLITQKGIAQRATATGRAVDSVLGNDPEYRTYQDARMALAGNLAVAQQGSRPSDADIKAIWLPLIPDVFRDTLESAQMKWGLINTMSNTPGGAPGSGLPAGPVNPDAPSGDLAGFFKANPR